MHIKTKTQALDRLDSLKGIQRTDAHQEAEDCLLEYLAHLGQGEVVNAYQRIFARKEAHVAG